MELKIGNNLISKNAIKAALAGLAVTAGYILTNVSGLTDNPAAVIFISAICYGIIDAIKHYN